MNLLMRLVILLLAIAGVVALLLGGIAAIIVWGMGSFDAGPSDLAFERSAWRSASANDETDESPRLLMANSFLKTQAPVGKTRAQIVQLLGEPDDTAYLSTYDMVYHLGPQRGAFGLDCEWLVFRLHDGIVSEARIVPD